METFEAFSWSYGKLYISMLRSTVLCDKGLNLIDPWFCIDFFRLKKVNLYTVIYYT